MSKSIKNIFKKIFICLLAGYLSLTPLLTARAQVELRGNIDETTVIPLGSGIKFENGNQTINMNLRDSDVRQVLRMLADRAGLNIILHDSVKGKISLDLNKTTLNKAFEYIMTLHELSYWQDGKTIIVASKEDSAKLSLSKNNIKLIKVKYVEAGAVAKFLNKNIFGLNKPNLSSGPSAVTNPVTNEVMIFGSENDIALAQKVIAHIDVKPRIKTFPLNYIDAETMAYLICDVIFKTASSSEEVDSDSDNSSSSSNSNNSRSSNSRNSNSSSNNSNSSNNNNNIDNTSSIACGTVNLIDTEKLESLGASSFSIMYDTQTSQVTLYGGTQEQLNLTAELIKKFDIKQPQVYIEISIVELNESGSKALGSVFSYTNGRTLLNLNPKNPILGYTYSGGMLPVGSPTEIPGTGLSVVDSTLLPKFFQQTVSMLVEQRKGRVLANPRIIATNNRPSVINISTDFIKTRKLDRTYVGTGQNDIITYEIGESGIKLTITPKISPNGYVTMSMVPSYTSQKEQVKEANEIVATLLNRRDLDLQNVRIKDGDTFVIGGLIQEENTSSQYKIPVLGDLPLIGSLFKSSSTDKSRSELIIMVTPKIVKDSDTDTI